MGWNVLGIESSCDETAVAVLSGKGEILANVLDSQVDIHANFGGVVPELASRRHMERLELLTGEALARAQISLAEVHGIAVTNCPGLVGALIVGLNFGKALAYAARVPYVTVNHLEGHLASAWLASPDLPFPSMMLVASGGHTHLAWVSKRGCYQFIGRTMDDAAGEAFDKGAKMLGLPYPGGPAIDALAKSGDPYRVPFPRPTLKSHGFNFSFSGLKTALLYYLRDRNQNEHSKVSLADIAASFQESIVEVLVEKLFRAAREYQAQSVALVGGVAANSRLREKAQVCARKEKMPFTIPPHALCTDNAAMIAAAGLEKITRQDWANWDADANSTVEWKTASLA